MLGLLGILLGLALIMVLAFRSWTILLLAPLAAAVAALFSGQPMLAHWTQTFMPAAAGFVAQFFPLFLLGALFGKLMDDSGSVSAIADYMTRRLGPSRAILAVVAAGAMVTYGGVSLFVAFFVLAPMGQALFKAGSVPRRLLPAALALGTSTFTMSAMPGTPAIQNAIPMPFFGTTPFAAPGLGIIASIIMAAIGLAILPLVLVVVVNLILTQFVLPGMDFDFLSQPAWGETTLSAVGGVWSVALALLVACIVLVAMNRRRFRNLRESIDSGATAAVLPIMSVASLVGFGAVVAALPAFEMVRDWVLGIGGGPLVSLAVATNILAALTGSASGGMTIALQALGPTFMQIASDTGLDPALMHRVAVIASGTLDSLPHNGAVVTMLAVCGCTHRESYLDIVMAAIVSALVALVAVIVLGTAFGSF